MNDTEYHNIFIEYKITLYGNTKLKTLDHANFKIFYFDVQFFFNI